MQKLATGALRALGSRVRNCQLAPSSESLPPSEGFNGSLRPLGGRGSPVSRAAVATTNQHAGQAALTPPAFSAAARAHDQRPAMLLTSVTTALPPRYDRHLLLLAVIVVVLSTPDVPARSGSACRHAWVARIIVRFRQSATRQVYLCPARRCQARLHHARQRGKAIHADARRSPTPQILLQQALSASFRQPVSQSASACQSASGRCCQPASARPSLRMSVSICQPVSARQSASVSISISSSCHQMP